MHAVQLNHPGNLNSKKTEVRRIFESSQFYTVFCKRLKISKREVKDMK